MPNEEGKFDALAKLGVSIHEVLRYGYGGLLTFLVAALIDPKLAKDVVDSLGVAICILVAFALGGAIYATYRHTVHVPLMWAGEFLHMWWSIMWQWKYGMGGYQCCTHYFRDKWKISFSLSREAYRTIRRSEIVNQNSQKEFYRQHSELYAVYVTFIVLMAGAIVVWLRQPPAAYVSGWALFWVALLFGAAAVLGDMALCRQECKAVMLLPENDIRSLLVKAEFIKSD